MTSLSPTQNELNELLPYLSEPERAELDLLLSLQNNFMPRGAARLLLENQAPEILLSGPAGTGKSRACLEKLNNLAWQYPRMRALIVRKTRESLSESALLTYERHVMGSSHPIVQGARRNVRQVYVYPNGSEIVVGGLKSSGKDMSQKVMSTEYDIIYVQEAIELETNEWEQLTTRLRNNVIPYQQLIADTNPSSPTHWLKLRCDAGQTLLLESRHEDNPALWDAERQRWTLQGLDYIAKLDRLTGPRKLRLRKGKWVQAEGVVYDGWDARIHLLSYDSDEFPFTETPASWRRIRSVDFGFTNPFVMHWWAIDGDGRMYLYRQMYMTQRTVKVHAGMIKVVSAGERYEVTVADHDAEDRATLHENGIRTQPARKEITVGIQAVQERLKVAGDGKPRLFIIRDSLVEPDDRLMDAKQPYSTEQEIDSYIWPKGADGKSIKELPVDKDNHGMDCMRYAVMYVDNPRVRMEDINVQARAESNRWEVKAGRDDRAPNEMPTSRWRR